MEEYDESYEDDTADAAPLSASGNRPGTGGQSRPPPHSPERAAAAAAAAPAGGAKGSQSPLLTVHSKCDRDIIVAFFISFLCHIY